MKPPEQTDVLDAHGGFTCESKPPSSVYRRFDERERVWNDRSWSMPHGDSLWRPGALLRAGTTGQLFDFDESSFYQNNDDVTLALYRVPGYGYPVMCWFDNRTRRRVDGSPPLTARHRIAIVATEPHAGCSGARGCIQPVSDEEKCR